MHQEKCCSGVPKTTLRFNNFLERLTKLGGKNLIVLTVIVYYCQKIEMTISDRIRHIGRGQENSSGPLPVKSSKQHLLLSATLCGTMNKVLPTRETRALVSSFSPLGISHVGMEHLHGRP